MSLDLLVIAAHPDDAEITCGGTIIKSVDSGRTVGVLDLTRGELGTLGTPETRLSEAAEAARLMGLTLRENLCLADGHIELSRENKSKLAACVRRLRPDTVILPHPDGQRHPDHRQAALLGYDGCFLAGLKKAAVDGEPFRPRRIIHAVSFLNIAPSFYIEISGEFERKVKAVAAYRSQFDGPEMAQRVYWPGSDIFELMELFHRRDGLAAGCRYAEAFWTSHPILLDDIMSIRMRST